MVTDGSVMSKGIAATLYIHWDEKLLQAVFFFSAKLRKHQVTWLPCEIEALDIGAAIRHFSPTLYSLLAKPRSSPTADIVFKYTRS